MTDMVTKSPPEGIVSEDEKQARLVEGELEYAVGLLRPSRLHPSIADGAEEIVHFHEEDGLTRWESVRLFAEEKTREYQLLLSEPDLSNVARDFIQRFSALYQQLVGMHSIDADTFDDRIHRHADTIAHAILDMLFLANQKREMFGQESPLSLPEAETHVGTKIVSRVHDMRRGTTGVISASSAKKVGDLGQIMREKVALGSLQVGPAFLDPMVSNGGNNGAEDRSFYSTIYYLRNRAYEQSVQPDVST